MANNNESVFFVDNELIERLMRGETGDLAKPGVRPAESDALATALKLLEENKLEEAARKLEQALPSHPNPVDLHCALGHIRFEQQQWEAATECYIHAAELNERHPAAFYNLGLCLERRKMYAEAADAFEAAVKNDASRWQAHLGRGLSLLHLDETEAALESLEQALKDQPSQERVLFGKAVALHKLGKLDEAAEIYRKLLPGNASSENLLMNLVAASLARKDDAKTKDFSERLLKVRPQSRQALEALASVALGRGDYSSAVQHCSQLVRVAPDSYSGWFNLGIAYQKTGRLQQAGNAYREAARLRPEAVEASANLGAALQEQADLAGARVAYNAALKNSPNQPGVLWNFALLAESEAKGAEQRELLEKLVKIDPAWEDASFRLGCLQLDAKNYPGAVESFTTCLKNREDCVEARINLGVAYWNLRDLDASVKQLEQAAGETGPTGETALRALTSIALERGDHNLAEQWYAKLEAAGAPTHELAFNLALQFAAHGEPEKAATLYRKSVEIKPDFAEGLLNLGCALDATGQTEEARKVWIQAIEAKPDLAAAYFQ